MIAAKGQRRVRRMAIAAKRGTLFMHRVLVEAASEDAAALVRDVRAGKRPIRAALNLR